MPIHGIGGAGPLNYSGHSEASPTVATVRVGEHTLTDVARRVGVDAHALSQANNNLELNKQLTVGQELRLPELVSKLEQRLDEQGKDLESQDKLGNFDIQTLMSDYNQEEQLASKLQKKQDDSSNDLLKKLG